MSTVQKIILSVLLSLFLFTSTLSPFLASKAYAQQTWYNQDFKSWYSRVYDSPPNDVFGERYTAAQVQWIIYGLMAFAINTATGDPKATACYMNNDLKNCVQHLQKVFSYVPSQENNVAIGAGGILKSIFLEDRPLSGISYVRNIGQNLHLVPEAKAQTPGFGFGALNPILPLWRASRNVAYGVLVIAVLAISFMIMFRVKINPQTVISVQSSLPKIIFALILITFSYAIAGFMVDIMYLVIGLFALAISTAYQGLLQGTLGGALLSRFGNLTDPGTLFNFMTIGPYADIPGTTIRAGTGIVGSLLVYIVLFFISLVVGLFGTTGLFGIILASGITIGISAIAWFIPVILALLIFVVLIWIFIRLLWMLLRTFAMIILSVTFAPIQIALGVVVPNLGFSSWLRTMASNLSVFPVTGLFFALAFYFLIAGMKLIFDALAPLGLGGILLGNISNLGSSVGWPPLLAFGTGVGQGLVFLGASIALLLSLPRVADIIQGIISGRPFAYGTAIGESLGPISTPTKFIWQAGTAAVSKGLAKSIGGLLGYGG